MLATIVFLQGCGGPSPPTGFGVNLTITVAPAFQQQFRRVELHVAGDESFVATLDIVAFKSGVARVRYVPGISAGTLAFSAIAFNATGAALAVGNSGPISLVHGKAVAAQIMVGSTIDDDAGVDGLVDMAPALKHQGQPCSPNDTCDSGYCVDGYCCDSACNTTCAACNVPGKEGNCAPLPAGMPHSACVQQPQASCQSDGTCDGKGACHLWGLGTECKPSQCSANSFTATSMCDGNGTCKTPPPIGCDPFTCQDTTQCWGSCTNPNQCASGHTCANGSCGPKSLGATCAGGTECASGFCADKVCCDTACTGQCNTCNQTGAPGHCTSVPNGQDPRHLCPTGTGVNATCAPGGCSGTSNSCAYASTSAQCQNPQCTSASGGTSAAMCDGAGTCKNTSLPPFTCTQYVCSGTGCLTSCNSDGDCLGGLVCPNHQCVVAMDMTQPPPDLSSVDGTPMQGPCVSTFGSGMSAAFGRLDGFVWSVVSVGDASCGGDSSHVHVQVKMNGAIYDIAVTTVDPGTVDFLEKDLTISGIWSEGWHTGASLDYPSLGLHSSAFTPTSSATIESMIKTELAAVNHVSIFTTGTGPTGGHLVNRTSSNHDGAIVLHPLEPTQHVLFFSFSTQSF